MTSILNNGRLPGGSIRGRMWRRLSRGLLLFGLLTRLASAHDGPSVIVDTDMASDDVRALALLLNCPYLNVLAIVTSDGVCPPDVGATNACRLLGFLKQSDVAVGLGRKQTAPPPSFRTNATALDWDKLGEPRIPRTGLHEAASLIRLMAKAAPDPIVYLCLGPLSNLADALEGDPGLAARIRSVLWYGTPPKVSPAGWNALRDEAAREKVIAAGLR